MMREPPGEPNAIATRPSRIRMVGAMDDSGRLPGAMALASPWTSPNRLGVSGATVKSSISSFISTPVPGAITLAPNAPFSV